MSLKSIDDLAPAPYNPRSIDKDAADGLRESLSRFGDISGITWNQRTGNLVTGHQRVAQLRKLGATLEADAEGVRLRAGDSVWPVRVVDMTEDEERAANVTANNEHISGRFTDELDALLGDLEVSLGGTAFRSLKLDSLLKDLDAAVSNSSDDSDEESIYTRRIESPVYEPKGPKPEVGELYDTTKTSSLAEAIAECELPDDVREFLLCAASRHTVFNYERIAEFYAHSGPAVQGLMEQSVLVIIDFQQAIADGFVRMSKAISEAYEVDDG